MARADQSLIFNPEEHTSDTLKSFDDFKTNFEFRYAAEFPDPPKVSMDSAIERWKYANTTDENTNPKPTIQQYDEIRDQWIQKDMVTKFVGLFSSQRLREDWQAAEPNDGVRKQATWQDFITKMRAYYKPTDNPVLVNYKFRSLTQNEGETFHAFCNRVDKESKSCYFNCDSPNCNADKIAVRDQVVIGTTNNKIKEEALLKSWKLDDLRKEGMKIESAMKGEAEISNSAVIDVNKVGKYSYKTLKNNSYKPQQSYSSESKEKTQPTQNRNAPKEKTCYNCGYTFKGNPLNHLQICPAKQSNCNKCGRVGHFIKMCRSKTVNQVDHEDEKPEPDDGIWSVNLFRIKTSTTPSMQSHHDFKVEVIVNNSLVSLIADTGARISVCSMREAEKWGILPKMIPSKAKIKPYNSDPIPVQGVARCAVTFGTRSIPVIWHIIQGVCEPILSGNAAVQLGILHFNENPQTLIPIHLIQSKCCINTKDEVQKIIVEYRDVFDTENLGKMNDYQVKFSENKNIKPVITPPRPTQYHLVDRVESELKRMVDQGVIEEHPRSEPAPWVSAAVIAPKPNGDIRITMDARNVNKAILSNNLSIPKQEDIKTKLSGAKLFSKLDLTSAFWQLELAPESRHLTVFECNGKLYRYKRMTMGIKTAQGELNAALRPILQDIPDAHHIHDDIILASKNVEDHMKTLKQVLQALRLSNLKVNPKKCEFIKDEIKFWGMIVSAKGIKPDPEKVEILKHLQPPKNKEDLRSFLCMMQSNAEFIPQFAKITAKLRELAKDKRRFRWNQDHQVAFEKTLESFKSNVSLRYFDPNLPIFIFTDAHITGLAATLSQGLTQESSKPVAFASRKTTEAESRYPQIDLEAMGVDFGLRRFRNYLIGAPESVTIITDHKPLVPVFNGNRTGTIRTEKIKSRNQDIDYQLKYQPGKMNEADFVSRNAKPFKLLSNDEKKEADEINNFLFMIHTTPITDRIGLSLIAQETTKDQILNELRERIKNGKTWIHKTAPAELKKFSPILQNITTTDSGILLKEDRIILPKSLQQEAIQLSHQGSHAGQSALQRRLRYHFFFHDMNKMVERYIKNCPDCALFTDKKCTEPLKYHAVPTKCWETVAVDLFGPLPSNKHVIVIQDLASRFPVAKLVKSTSADHVLPTLADTYDLLGNPENQISDNGPPFNSKAMETFAQKRSIKLTKTPPFHPSSNPAETFMKPLGKSMKIAISNKTPENIAIKELLESYRDTPHPATGIPPNSMLFRDQPQTQFPRRIIPESEISKARARDDYKKKIRTNEINNSKYKQKSTFKVGEHVLVRNNRKSKFEPYFSPDDYIVSEILHEGSVIKIKREDGKTFLRHPDDLKSNIKTKPLSKQLLPDPVNPFIKWRNEVMSGKRNQVYDSDHENIDFHPRYEQPPPPPPRPGRGRPPGPRQPPVLDLPPDPQEFQDVEMPELTPVVRRSQRVAAQKQ